MANERDKHLCMKILIWTGLYQFLPQNDVVQNYGLAIACLRGMNQFYSNYLLFLSLFFFDYFVQNPWMLQILILIPYEMTSMMIQYLFQKIETCSPQQKCRASEGFQFSAKSCPFLADSGFLEYPAAVHSSE